MGIKAIFIQRPSFSTDHNRGFGPGVRRFEARIAGIERCPQLPFGRKHPGAWAPHLGKFLCVKMDSLNLCGEKVLYVGSSIAHHCNFVTLKRETGALVKTCKAYGSVWDPHMFFPGRNFFQVVEREIALNRPSVVILQSSSVDITVLKEKRLTWD